MVSRRSGGQKATIQAFRPSKLLPCRHDRYQHRLMRLSSLLERGEVQWKLEDLDPEVAVTRALQACEGIVREAGINIERLPCESPVTVHAHMDRLCQVLINLVSNAIKYNDNPNPLVVVSSSVDSGEFQVLVEDNGPGIADGDRSRLFTKFSRGMRQQAQGGAGLGLAIAWEIMRHFGGRLELLRSSSGQGSCFMIALPVVREDGSKSPGARSGGARL